METPEEAASKYSHSKAQLDIERKDDNELISRLKVARFTAFQEGIEWQKEQAKSYSKEEVITIPIADIENKLEELANTPYDTDNKKAAMLIKMLVYEELLTKYSK